MRCGEMPIEIGPRARRSFSSAAPTLKPAPAGDGRLPMLRYQQ
jgi:hypothetical protein